MPIRHWNPAAIAPPSSRFSHVALATGVTRHLHLSGQVGTTPDGQTVEGLAAQMDAALANVDAGLTAAGMTRANLMKLVVYLTEATPEAVATYRARRDHWVGDASPPAATLLVVAGLANPAWLVEVDAYAAD
jgi:2-iminobutanoate/2-iminopropanoate deaminase